LLGFSPNGATQPQPRATPWEKITKRQSPEGATQVMPQSLARLYVHLIFSTKNREQILHDQIRQPLHSYVAVVLQSLECSPTLLNSVEDHVHILFELARTVSVSQAVEEVKKSSSKWIKTQGAEFAGFAWQAGYGAFAVSESNVQTVRDYIADQREHHRQKSFQDEYRAFLKRHNVIYDERYVWD
jgi:putative transposase